MGQKVNPTSLRVGINKYWQSTWFEKKSYSTFLKEDHKIRNYIEKNYREIFELTYYIHRLQIYSYLLLNDFVIFLLFLLYP